MISELIFWTFSIAYLIFLLVLGTSLLFSLFTQIPFVPSRKHVINKIIELADIKDNETVLDLGCGDLRLLIKASKDKEINAIGYELSPFPYLLGKLNKFIQQSKAEIEFKNFLKTDISNADVIFIYLIPDILEKLGKKIQNECKNGTRIISHTFKIPNLPITKIYQKDKAKNLPNIYIYHISK